MNAAQAEPLFAEFPPVSTAEWEAAIVKDLKGKDPKSLVWKTEDGFEVKPFYRLEDSPGLPALRDFPTGWKICAEVTDFETAMEVVARGAQAIQYWPENEDALESLLSRLPLTKVEVHIRAGGQAASLLRVIRHFKGRVHGSLNCGPTHEAANIAPDFIPFVINAGRFDEIEATATQELALALAQGSEYLADLGLVADQIAFSFPVGSNYFFEIAKLRAARLLWPRIVKAYDPHARPATRIFAKTSEWNKTVYDPYVNMLRETTEAMSAIVGGAELVTVSPFNSAFAAPDEFARRMSVNTQLILREEAHFDELSDPASGSWYIESLTDTMAREAWKLFQQMEAAGGYSKAVGSGLVDSLVKPVRVARRAAIAQRRRQFTGLNVHANPAERVLDKIAVPSEHSRGASDFEAMRLRTERYEKTTGKTPKVFLLLFGDAKMRRARAEFATEFFQCAGFAIVRPAAFDTVAAALAAVESEKPDFVVLCSSDPEYPGLAVEVCPRLTQPVIVAGFPKDALEQLKQAGVAEFVHIRSNALETLTALQRKLGIGD
jgi:methylmalonyl-CoA mutase